MSQNHLRILHLASFSGNIGDIESQKSFRRWFDKLLPDFEITWINFEIRNFFRREHEVFESFDSQVTQSDLVVVGGGNFLELWPEDSPSGTSLPFGLDYLKKVDTPFFINAIGVDDGQGVGKVAAEKFSEFINALASSRRVFLSFRNDGSIQTVKKFLNQENLVACRNLPDHGFFTLEEKSKPKTNELTLGINLAIDMPRIRFENYQGSAESFLIQFAHSIESLASNFTQLRFQFIPHMFSDLEAYSLVLRNLSDKTRREKVTVSPYDATANSNVANLAYNQISMLIAMRFHSHVFGLEREIPTFSLVSYPQIAKLIKDISINNWPQHSLNENHKLLNERLFDFISSNLNSDFISLRESIRKYLGNLYEQRKITGEELHKWIFEVVV